MSDESAGSTDKDIPLDEMLDLLANRQRRCLLACLQEEADPSVSLGDAATYITDHIADQTGHRPPEDDVKVQLQHHHLPRFADLSLVDYDARSGDIRYHEHDQVEAFLDHVQAFDPG